MFWNKTDAIELIDLTYAAFEDSSVADALFERITSLFGECVFGMQIWDEAILVDEESIFFYGWESDEVARYAEYYYSINPYLPLIGERKSGDVYQLKDLIQPELVLNTEFHNLFHEPRGNLSGVIATILKEEDRAGALSIDGPGHTAERWDEMETLLKILTPHMQRAMQLSRQMQDVSLFRSIAEAAMDRISANIIVVDAKARIKFANEGATHLIREGRSLSTAMGGRLIAGTSKQTHEIRNLIAAVTARDTPSAGGYVMLKTAGEGQTGSEPLTAMVMPLPRGSQVRLGLVETWTENKTFAAIFLTDGNSNTRLPADVLMVHYNLTKTEAQIASYLCDGRSIGQYCEEKHVTTNTTRTQLKSIFNKTGVSRQSELVALLSNLAVFSQR